jgi:hypothetical protein
MPQRCANYFAPIKVLAPIGVCRTPEGNEGSCPHGPDVEKQVKCRFYRGLKPSIDRPFWNAKVVASFEKGEELTEKAVTCKKCLSLRKNEMDELKNLAIKSSDLESDFNQLAKKCEHFKLEGAENAQIFHSLPLKFCLYYRRLEPQKYPGLCNIIDCPLKYEK